MKRILYIGDLNTYSRSYHIYQALKELLNTVEALSYAPLGEISGVTKRPSLVQRGWRKLGLPLDSVNLNQKMLNNLKQQGCIDLLFINQGLTIRPATILQFKRQCPKLFILYLTLDNMLIRRNRSFQLLGYLPLVDLYLSPPRVDHAEQLRKIGVTQFRVFPTSFNSYEFTPRPDNLAFKRDVVFIGTYEKYRYESMEYLATNGIKVIIFGSGWPREIPRHLSNMLQIQYRPIFEEELLKVLHTSRIALNFIRRSNQDLITDRTVEIPATKTFMLSERTDEQLRYFVEGKEAEFFGSDDELLKKVRYYLTHPEERACIASAGRRRCEAGSYSYHERLTNLLGDLDLDDDNN